MTGQLNAAVMQIPVAVDVFAPARLHLGFLDLNGGLGRRFGSIGLTIEGIGTHLTLRVGSSRKVEGPSADRAEDYLDALAGALRAPSPLDLTLHQTIPEHVGLGSGTQLGLAIAAGLSALNGRPRPPRTLSSLVERGARSGIGIGSFEFGGFLVDGGKGSRDAPAPIIARADFPEAWRLILVIDAARRGLSGEAEKSAFSALSTFPSDTAAHLCRIVLMRLLPGLAETDFSAVSSSIGEIQDRVGDHFAPVQGGRYASPHVAAVLNWLRRSGLSGVGQSSWGPTGFALVDSAERATALLQELKQHFSQTTLSFQVCAARNKGAEIRIRHR
jgi:beta-ribofuranosylaminobenzene 5'-phosphate synthase